MTLEHKLLEVLALLQLSQLSLLTEGQQGRGLYLVAAVQLHGPLKRSSLRTCVSLGYKGAEKT